MVALGATWRPASIGGRKTRDRAAADTVDGDALRWRDLGDLAEGHGCPVLGENEDVRRGRGAVE
jgi:hypothetical protein